MENKIKLFARVVNGEPMAVMEILKDVLTADNARQKIPEDQIRLLYQISKETLPGAKAVLTKNPSEKTEAKIESLVFKYRGADLIKDMRTYTNSLSALVERIVLKKEE